jgi:hypothetical protein
MRRMNRRLFGTISILGLRFLRNFWTQTLFRPSLLFTFNNLRIGQSLPQSVSGETTPSIELIVLSLEVRRVLHLPFFPGYPLPDVQRTVNKLDTIRFTTNQESNAVAIQEGNFL